MPKVTTSVWRAVFQPRHRPTIVLPLVYCPVDYTLFEISILILAVRFFLRHSVDSDKNITHQNVNISNVTSKKISAFYLDQMSLNIRDIQLNRDMQRPIASCIELVIFTGTVWAVYRLLSFWQWRFFARCHNITLQISKFLIITEVVLLQHNADVIKQRSSWQEYSYENVMCQIQRYIIRLPESDWLDNRAVQAAFEFTDSTSHTGLDNIWLLACFSQWMITAEI